jgi:hypothetical protein
MPSQLVITKVTKDVPYIHVFSKSVSRNLASNGCPFKMSSNLVATGKI